MSKPSSAIGLSMLDLISNSLAAVIILFIILASMRKPSIPPERVKGTLFIRYELVADQEPSQTESEIWVEPPLLNSSTYYGKERFWEEEVMEMNTNSSFFGQHSDCNGKVLEWKRNKGRIVPPCAMVYSPIDSLFIHYLTIRDPLKGYWTTGILYTDHPNIPKVKRKGKAKINAWFVGHELQGSIPVQEDSTVMATTDAYGYRFEVPDWNKTN